MLILSGSNWVFSFSNMEHPKLIYLDNATEKQLLTIPQIGPKFCMTIMDMQEKAQVKGTHVSLSDFDDTPALATALNNAVVSGLLIVGPGRGSPALSDEDAEYRFPEREGRGRERIHKQAPTELQNFMAEFTEQWNIKQQVVDAQNAKFKEMFSKLIDQSERIEQTMKNMDSRVGTLEQEKVVSQTYPVKPEHPVPVVPDPYIQHMEKVIEQKSPPVPACLQRNGQSDRYDFPKLKVYDGKEDFNAFIERFERVARAKKWDDSQKLDHLCVILIGDPSEYMHWQKADVKKSYTKAKEVLARVFGKETNPSVVRAALTNVQQKDGEELDEYGRRIFRLLYQAFPDASEKMLEDLGIGYYSRGCTDRYAVEIAMIRDPKTLKEAIQFTKVAQSNHTFIGQGKRSVRNVTFADEGNVSFRRMQGGDSPQGGQTQLQDGSLEKMTDILSKMLTVIEH